MTDLSHAKIGDIVEDASEFFAPASADLVDGLIGGYLSERGRIEQLHEMMTGGDSAAPSGTSWKGIRVIKAATTPPISRA